LHHEEQQITIKSNQSTLKSKCYIESSKGYNASDAVLVKKLQDEASERLMAYIYLENADRKKYGTILSNLTSQKSLGNDQYPKTLIESNNVLGSHRFDANKTHKSQPRKDNEFKEKDQENDTIPPQSFAQMEGKCYCCGKPGHKSPSCRHKSKPKDEWAINKAEINQQQQHAQQDKKIDEIKVSTNTSAAESQITSPGDDASVNTVGWAGAQYQLNYQLIQSLDMHDEILLDTASSTSLFGNKEYVSGI
jgi:hypothetical protein